ncbi:MAG: RNase P subunit p30 family protein [archaeon]
MKNTILIKETNFEKARKKIRESKAQIIFSSDDDELNRKILEKEKINILLLNQKNRKDFSKQRNSGLNQVMAKIAKKNNIAIGINLDEILNSKPKEKSDILGRIRQNIKLCNKSKLEMIFIGRKKSPYDLKALGLVLGMPTFMIKNFN